MDAKQQVMQVIGHAALGHSHGRTKIRNRDDAKAFVVAAHDIFGDNRIIARGLSWEMVATEVYHAAYGYTIYNGFVQNQSQEEKDVDAYVYIPSHRGEAMSNAHKMLQRIRFNMPFEGYNHGPTTFYDIGCGIGDKLLLGYAAGFDRAIGVEMNEGTSYVARCVLDQTLHLPVNISTMNAFDLALVEDNSMLYTYMPIRDEDTLEKLYAHIFDLMSRSSNVVHHECSFVDNSAYLIALKKLLDSGKCKESYLEDDGDRAYVRSLNDGTLQVNISRSAKKWIREVTE